MSIICIEGIDGSGKQTQCALLRDMILSRIPGVSCHVHDFPHQSSVTGPVIKELLQGLWYVHEHGYQDGKGSFEPVVLQALQTINRYEALDSLRQAKANPSHVLILDRYFASAIAYGMADGLSEEFLTSIHAGLPEADLSILIDIPVALSMSRRPERDDLYESDSKFLETVRENYIKLFNHDNSSIGKTRILHGDTSEAELTNKLFSLIIDVVRPTITL